MTTQFMRNYIDLINEADSGPADIGQIAATPDAVKRIEELINYK